MAKSAKAISKKKSVVKKSTKPAEVKKSILKKSSISKKNTPAKVDAIKKAGKKIPAKKATVASKSLKNINPVKGNYEKNSIPKTGNDPNPLKNKKTATGKISTSQTKAIIKKGKPLPEKKSKVISIKKSLNEQTAMANDYTELIEGSNGITGKKQETGIEHPAQNNTDQLHTGVSAIPAPEEKYKRPVDPFHGKKSTVKSKSNITPSGKKPLWNK